MARWLPPVYEIRTEFRAPLAYVFRWCTDYRPDDSRRSGETFERRILSRSSRSVLFEDLWWKRDGWRWRRTKVSLKPPNRWVADSMGNVRVAQLDYRLTVLPGDRTRLEIQMHRRPGVREPKQPLKRVLEAEIVRMWKGYGKALETDYRRSRK